MSRETIHVRECDRCKLEVEARGTDDFNGWGFANATGERDGDKVGFASADLCPECLGHLIAWFTAIIREKDAERTHVPRAAPPVVPPVKEIAARLIADNFGQAPQMDDYFHALDAISSRDELQEFQAKNALALMGWMADPALSPQIVDRHRAAYERLADAL